MRCATRCILSFVGTFIEFWFGMGIALLLNTHVARGRTSAAPCSIMPTTIAPIVVGFLFRYMYYERGGLITWLLTHGGLPGAAAGLAGQRQHGAGRGRPGRYLAVDAVFRHRAVRRAAGDP